MTLNAARDRSVSRDRPNTTPDFLGSRQCTKSLTRVGERKGVAERCVCVFNGRKMCVCMSACFSVWKAGERALLFMRLGGDKREEFKLLIAQDTFGIQDQQMVISNRQPIIKNAVFSPSGNSSLRITYCIQTALDTVTTPAPTTLYMFVCVYKLN